MRGIDHSDPAFVAARRAKNSRRVALIRRLVREHAGMDLQGKRVLEYGCHLGFAVSALTADNALCLGLDVDKQVLGAAAGRKEAVFFSAAGPGLPFADQSFDFVFSSEVIEHVPPTHWRGYIAEFHRVLAPRGVGYISYPNFWFPIEQHHFIPFYHWLPRGLRKQAMFEAIPRTRALQRLLARWFILTDISNRFLDSPYARSLHAPWLYRLVRLLARTPCTPHTYLLLRKRHG